MDFVGSHFLQNPYFKKFLKNVKHFTNNKIIPTFTFQEGDNFVDKESKFFNKILDVWPIVHLYHASS